MKTRRQHRRFIRRKNKQEPDCCEWLRQNEEVLTEMMNWWLDNKDTLDQIIKLWQMQHKKS